MSKYVVALRLRIRTERKPEFVNSVAKLEMYNQLTMFKRKLTLSELQLCCNKI